MNEISPTVEDLARDLPKDLADCDRVATIADHGHRADVILRILHKAAPAALRRLIALDAVIREVHSQHADDLCWMDIDRIFAAAGLPVPDRGVGCKEAMKANCERFIDTMCQGGKWRSYAELEADNARLRDALERINRIWMESTRSWEDDCNDMRVVAALALQDMAIPDNLYGSTATHTESDDDVPGYCVECGCELHSNANLVCGECFRDEDDT